MYRYAHRCPKCSGPNTLHRYHHLCRVCSELICQANQVRRYLEWVAQPSSNLHKADLSLGSLSVTSGLLARCPAPRWRRIALDHTTLKVYTKGL